MKASALKEELLRRIEQEEDLSILKDLMSILDKDIDPLLREELTIRALESEKDIAEGLTMAREDAKKVFEIQEMKIQYTIRALRSLERIISFYSEKISPQKLEEFEDSIFDRADKLLDNPYAGQEEIHLGHLAMGHRRMIHGHYKIIYRVIGETIFVTDIFDSRQHPSKMKP